MAVGLLIFASRQAVRLETTARVNRLWSVALSSPALGLCGHQYAAGSGRESPIIDSIIRLFVTDRFMVAAS